MDKPIPMTVGAIILCGGRSTRMKSDKAWLPFGPNEVMLQRVARKVGEVIEAKRTVVVAAVDQELPILPADVRVARDHCPERGPMEGLAAGLRALVHDADAAFVTSCDVPLLRANFVARLLELVEDGRADQQVDAVVPREGNFHHPLSSVYRLSLLPTVERLLATDRLRLQFIFETCRTREVPVEDLRAVDPSLDSLTNCNRPEEYAAALRRSGLEPRVQSL